VSEQLRLGDQADPIEEVSELLGPQPPKLRGAVQPAATNPVARVLVETVHPHLAHAFDYGVPAQFDAEARPGVRVRVRFAGRLVSGFILARVATTEHVGELAPLQRVVSALPVLREDLLALTRAIATRYAGTLPDVLRLAIPPRHAAAEKAVLARPEGVDEEALRSACTTLEERESAAALAHPDPAPPAWEDYLEALEAYVGPASGAPANGDTAQPAAGAGPRAAYCVMPGATPGTGWARAGLQAAQTVLAAGRSVLWLVPDARELAELERHLAGLGGIHCVLTAEQGPHARWSAWVSALTGRTRLVIGTRTAAFAPLSDLGLIICFDDDNDSYQEQRAPYPHARAIVLERVRAAGCALLFLDYSRSVAVAQLVSTGWIGDVHTPRDLRRSQAPLVFQPPPARSLADFSNLPERAFEIIRAALAGGRHREAVGPVLVQVPRVGYAPVVACDTCYEIIRCPACSRPLAAAGPGGPFACRACGFRAERMRCANCGGTRLRSVVHGLDAVRRQLGRAFPGTRVLASGGGAVLARIDPDRVIVVATTGAEPYVEDGYAAAVLLDSLWPGPSLRSADRAIARRMRALSLVRGAHLGGRALVLDDDPNLLRVLTRYEPVEWAAHEATQRSGLGLPPAVRTMRISGSREACEALLAELRRYGEPTVLLNDFDPPGLTLGMSLVEAPALTEAAAAWISSRSLARAELPGVRVDAPDAL
jgi:primosomal protein N' (replication factor Y)